MLGFLLRATITALALWVASQLLDGLQFSSTGKLALAAVLLGVVNAFVRPIAFVLTLPITVLTLGLFLLVLNVFLLVLGSVLEIYAAIVVLAPLVAPAGAAFGIDPVHLGVIFLANLELGFLFPPVVLNLFLSSSRFGKPLPKVARHTFPFLLILAVGVALITYVPAMSMGVLTFLGKH